MIFIRPLTTIACGAVGLGLVALDILRSNVLSKPTFAEISHPALNITVSASERLFEYAHHTTRDEVNPDFIAEVTRDATERLLLAADAKNLGLDWETFRLHFYSISRSVPRIQVVVRVDVLQ